MLLCSGHCRHGAKGYRYSIVSDRGWSTDCGCGIGSTEASVAV